MTTTTFRAAVVTRPGEADAISVLDLPVSPLEAGQIRVAVAAATVNPVDLAVRDGVFHQAGVDPPARAHRARLGLLRHRPRGRRRAST